MQQFCVKIDDERGQIIFFKENMQTVKIVWNLTQNCENPKIISKKKNPFSHHELLLEHFQRKIKRIKRKKKRNKILNFKSVHHHHPSQTHTHNNINTTTQ